MMQKVQQKNSLQKVHGHRFNQALADSRPYLIHKHRVYMMRFLFCISLAAVFHLRLSDGAGFTSHNTFARRTSQFEYFGPESDTFNTAAFYGLARDRSDAIQGGAPYPDYLYACGSDHDAGEEAHWTPFQIAAANYIREVYPDWASQTRDMDGPGLVAFFLGVTSHYIADMNWHGLETIPSGEGIIRNMGFADFNCTNGDLCQTAHTAADTGGEFAASYLLNISWYPTKWYLPVDDLVNIYKLVNIEVKDTWIRECGVIFYAGSFAISHFGDILYDLVMAKRVGGLLLETYVDFPVGGVDDNAAWTGFMWNRFAKWVSEGPPETYPNRRLSEDVDEPQSPATAIRRKLSQRKFTRGVREALLQQGVLPLSNHVSATVEHSPLQMQATYDPLFKVSSQSGSKASFIGIRDKATNLLSTKSTVGSMVRDRQRIGEQRTRDRALLRALADTLVEDYVLHAGNEDMDEVEKIELSDRDMAYLKSVLYSRVDRILDEQYDTGKVEPTSKLPGAGRKQPPNGKGIPVKIPPINGGGAAVEATTVLSGTAPHEYLGSSVTVGDFSGSGKSCDILVGSYGSGVAGGPQQGKAQILFNAACQSNTPSAPSSNTRTLEFLGAVTAPDHLPGYERFGYATEACDVNLDGSLDIIVCAPSFGGRNVSAAAGNYSGRCDFFLGPFEPADTTLDASSVPVPDFSIFGDRNWGLFGSTIKVGDVDKDGKKDIVISAHAAGSYPDIAANDRGDLSSQGAVYIFLASSFNTLFTKRPLAPRTVSYQASEAASYTLQRPISFQWFGKSLEIVETTSKLESNLLLVGAPFYHSEQPGEMTSAVGRVFAYSVPRKAASTSPSSMSSSKTLDYVWTLTGSHHAGRTGCSLSYSPSTGLLAIGESAYNNTFDVSVPLVSEYSRISVEGVLRSGRVLVASLSAIQDAATTAVNRDLLVKDIELWADKSKATFLAPLKPSFDARFGSSVKFHTSAETGKEQLLVSAPLQFNGAGSLFGYDVTFKLVTPIVIKESWSVTGRDVEEKRGRLGYTFVPYATTDSVTGAVSDAILVSGPFSNAGGVAPDGDQLGTLFSLQIVPGSSTNRAQETDVHHWFSYFVDLFFSIQSVLFQWMYSVHL